MKKTLGNLFKLEVVIAVQIIFMTVFASAWAQESHFKCAQDPLLQKMIGRWEAKGKRTYLNSTRVLFIEVKTESFCEEGGLVSVNDYQVREKEEEKHYRLVYWIGSLEQQQGEYLLGSGAQVGEKPREAKAFFNAQKNTFSVTETLYDGKASVQTESIFDGDRVHYKETLKAGSVAVSEGLLLFQKVD